MRTPGRKPGARGNSGFLLASNDPLLASASPKINLNAAALEKPHSPFPIYWRPGRGGPGLTFAEIGGET